MNLKYDHAEVARVAIAAHERGEGMAAAVADAFSLNLPAAWNLVDRARASYPIPSLIAGQPVEPDTSWVRFRECADTSMMFPHDRWGFERAREVCAGCRVRTECLEYALAMDERFGVWGGKSERERRAIQRERRRAARDQEMAA